jgi:hypothetical protein
MQEKVSGPVSRHPDAVKPSAILEPIRTAINGVDPAY